MICKVGDIAEDEIAFRAQFQPQLLVDCSPSGTWHLGSVLRSSIASQTCRTGLTLVLVGIEDAAGVSSQQGQVRMSPFKIESRQEYMKYGDSLLESIITGETLLNIMDEISSPCQSVGKGEACWAGFQDVLVRVVPFPVSNNLRSITLELKAIIQRTRLVTAAGSYWAVDAQ